MNVYHKIASKTLTSNHIISVFILCSIQSQKYEIFAYPSGRPQPHLQNVEINKIIYFVFVFLYQRNDRMLFAHPSAQFTTPTRLLFLSTSGPPLSRQNELTSMLMSSILFDYTFVEGNVYSDSDTYVANAMAFPANCTQMTLVNMSSEKVPTFTNTSDFNNQSLKMFRQFPIRLLRFFANEWKKD